MRFYRGYDKSVGVISEATFNWLSDDKEYAAMYGNCIAEIVIDETLINCPPYYGLEEIADRKKNSISPLQKLSSSNYCCKIALAC